MDWANAFFLTPIAELVRARWVSWGIRLELILAARLGQVHRQVRGELRQLVLQLDLTGAPVQHSVQTRFVPGNCELEAGGLPLG